MTTLCPAGERGDAQSGAARLFRPVREAPPKAQSGASTCTCRSKGSRPRPVGAHVHQNPLFLYAALPRLPHRWRARLWIACLTPGRASSRLQAVSNRHAGSSALADESDPSPAPASSNPVAAMPGGSDYLILKRRAQEETRMVYEGVSPRPPQRGRSLDHVAPSAVSHRVCHACLLATGRQGQLRRCRQRRVGDQDVGLHRESANAAAISVHPCSRRGGSQRSAAAAPADAAGRASHAPAAA